MRDDHEKQYRDFCKMLTKFGRTLARDMEVAGFTPFETASVFSNTAIELSASSIGALDTVSYLRDQADELEKLIKRKSN